jgi:hypothetical protein
MVVRTMAQKRRIVTAENLQISARPHLGGLNVARQGAHAKGISFALRSKSHRTRVL